jgi:hypothetical protein
MQYPLQLGAFCVPLDMIYPNPEFTAHLYHQNVLRDTYDLPFNACCIEVTKYELKYRVGNQEFTTKLTTK